jgi:flagellar motor switch protein FliG
MTKQEKVGVLLKALPAPVVEKLLGQLPAERSALLRAQLDQLTQSPPSAAQTREVFVEFDAVLNEITSRSIRDQVNSILEEQLTRTKDTYEPSSDAASREAEATSAQSTESQTDEPKQGAEPPTDPLDCLRALPTEQLLRGIKSEQPRSIAFVLSFLEPSPAGDVLRRLPAAVRADVGYQLGCGFEVDNEVAQCVARAVVAKGQFETSAEAPAPDSRLRRMAGMLRSLAKAERQELLAALDAKDSAMAAGIKEFLYSFDDLLRIEARSMQKLLGELDSKTLASALRGAAEDIRDRVFANLSKRAKESLTEEMEFLSSVPQSQVEQAQKAIVEVIQRLDQAGELEMTS